MIARLLKLLLLPLVIGFYGACFAQPQGGETVEWINNRGEEYIKSVTGNSSLHWELDEYGSFRITDYDPSREPGEDKILMKQYTYLNLYELNAKSVTIETSGNSHSPTLLLHCREEKGNCIRTRNDFKDASLKTKETAVLSFNLESGFDPWQGKRLEDMLVHAIMLFRSDPEESDDNFIKEDEDSKN